MSQEKLLGMDEGALRKLLEATVDLAERRQIRSAIRELQRQELEWDEEALASKRFRAERGSHRQDDKENWPRSRRLEEEEQMALAALSRQLEAITDVEELTKLLRAAGEYEERKLIRAAIRKLRAEEIEAAALAVNAQSRRGRGSERPAEPREEESGRRDDAGAPAPAAREKSSQRADTELPAPAGHRESHGEGTAKPLAAGSNGEHGQQDDTEPGREESSYGGAAELPPAQEHKGSVAHEPDEIVEQEHGPAGMQELHRQPTGDLQKPSTQATVSGTLVVLELQPAPELGPEPEDSGKELERDQPCPLGTAQPKGQHQTAWKEGSLGSPAPAREPTEGQSQAEQLPSAGSRSSQLSVRVCSQVVGPAGRRGELPVVSVLAPGTPARLGTHRGEQESSSSRHPAGCTEPSPSAAPTRAASVRERAQRFTPAGPGPALGAATATAGPAGAGGSGGRAGAGQWQREPRTAPPGPAQNARGGSGRGAEQRPAPVCAGPRPGPCPGPGLDGMKTYFTIEIKDGRIQPLTPRVVAAPGQRAEVTLGLRNTPIRITTVPGGAPTVCTISSISSNVTKDPCAHFKGTEEPGGPMAHPPAFSSTRQQSTLQLSRSDSTVSAGSPAPRQPPEAGGQEGGTAPQGSQRPQGCQEPRQRPWHEMEPEVVVEQHQVPRLEPEMPNGMEKVQARELERRNKLNIEELNRIEDEDVLDKMLDQTTDFEERRLIRNAMRELRQRKRDQREKERDQRLQEMRSQAVVGRTGTATETTTTQSSQSADGSAHSTVTKTERLVQSSDGTKTSRTTTMESSYVKRSDTGNSTFVQTKSSYSSSSKKTGSIFDREDESASRQSSLAALERRQAEKKKELMKAQSLPKTSASQARKAMMEKLQKEGGSSPGPAAARGTVQRSSSCGVPNANSIKQMLLDWCRAKTRGYEHVDIQNFSSSWSDGMAFCALVHNFFPDAFDYSQLSPQNRRHNFEVAFSSAEKHADCPQLLDVEDMVRMREPDWKCVYTYIQEFYRCLVQKGLVKTKKS
ncbi:smoothelin isoform X2 [Melanerpes formicivorus]|uniref:smoothelin isoform X2 n=1 Tax=Melanerpes formicivorus TaxID=211600 RepID=UPI00358F241A